MSFNPYQSTQQFASSLSGMTAGKMVSIGLSMVMIIFLLVGLKNLTDKVFKNSQCSSMDSSNTKNVNKATIVILWLTLGLGLLGSGLALVQGIVGQQMVMTSF